MPLLIEQAEDPQTEGKHAAATKRRPGRPPKKPETEEQKKRRIISMLENGGEKKKASHGTHPKKKKEVSRPPGDEDAGADGVVDDGAVVTTGKKYTPPIALKMEYLKEYESMVKKPEQFPDPKAAWYNLNRKGSFNQCLDKWATSCRDQYWVMFAKASGISSYLCRPRCGS